MEGRYEDSGSAARYIGMVVKARDIVVGRYKRRAGGGGTWRSEVYIYGVYVYEKEKYICMAIKKSIEKGICIYRCIKRCI